MNRHVCRSFAILALAVALPVLSGCAASRTTKGAVIGAAAGGVAGGIIGKHQGSTAKGVIIGAVLGGAAGAIIGHQMDRQARELEQEIPGATIERVGEGIHITFDSGLMFDFDSDDIRGAARENLDVLASSLEKYDNSDLLIAGHTDAIGSESYNQVLSERRAESAARYLRSRGVDREITTLGLGEMEPVATNETDGGRRENRRVEIAIYASEEARQDALREARS